MNDKGEGPLVPPGTEAGPEDEQPDEIELAIEPADAPELPGDDVDSYQAPDDDGHGHQAPDDDGHGHQALDEDEESTDPGYPAPVLIEDPDDGSRAEEPPELPPEQPPEAISVEPARRPRPRRETTGPRPGGVVMALASGKGGVGKSLLAASVGIYLAQLGKRVVLVDGNLGSGNLHTLLGVDQPHGSLHAFLRKEVQQLEEVIDETPFSGLGLISGHDDGVGAANPRPVQKKRLLTQIRTLPLDYVLIDLPSSTAYNALDLFLAADLHVVLTVPEPPAIESAFRFIKSAFVRKVSALPGVEQLLADMQPTSHCGIPTPYQMQMLARERDPNLGEALLDAMAGFKPRLVVNKTRARDDLELGRALCVVGRRHLALPMDYLGYVENDDMVWVTIRKRRPLLVEYPEAKVCRDIQRVARRMLSLETKERPECIGVPQALHQQNHYEILGLHPGATEEEVRRAQRRVRRVYGPDSSAIFGIAPPGEVDFMLRRVDEAYATLVDPEKRHLYNQALFPGGRVLEEELEDTSADGVREGLLEPPVPPALGEPTDLPPMDPDTEFTGDLLRQIREAHNVDLQDVAERTKISMTYLRAIENEDFAAMPAPVYLRGFLKIIARELKLDIKQVVSTYMARHDASVPAE